MACGSLSREHQGGVSCIDVPDSNITKFNKGIRHGGLNSGCVDSSRTRSTHYTRSWWQGSGWKPSIKPKHVGGWAIVPEAHDENHSAFQSLTHLGKSTLLLKIVGFTENHLRSITKFVGDGVKWFQRREIGGCVLDHSAVLDVKASDLNELALRSAVMRQKLSHHRHLLGAVDSLVWPKKVAST